MEQNVSLHDKMLAHLYRYRYVRNDIEYDAPYELTQEGSGIAIGITRSHASIILARMMDKGEVSTSKSIIKGAPKAIRRKVYHITP